MANTEFQVRLVVYVEIILLIVGTLGAVVVICLPSVFIDSILLEEETNPDKRAELKSELGTLIAIVAAVVVIILLIWLIIVILLYVGAKERSIGRLMSWLIINCIVCALQIFGILVTLVLNPHMFVIHIPSFIFLAYRIWSLYVVRSFMIDIRFRPQPQYMSVQYSQPYYGDGTSQPQCSHTQPHLSFNN